jgi:non-specific serine/threonine protein kinase
MFEIGPFRLDAGTKAVTHAGAPVELGPRAVAVLAVLAESAPEYVTKARLIDEAWPGLVVEEANLAVQISAIRRVLGRAGGEQWIETLSRRGYRFVGPVTKLAEHAASSAKPRSNLPGALTSFVGRERELAEVRKLLEEQRLVTLTGAGGVGKTRLALRVAEAALQNGYRDGVWLVELAALSDPALVPLAVTGVLGLKEQPGKGPVDRLVEYLAGRRLLLMLDNAEHLLPACAHLTEAVLARCPQTTLLVTSRERLGVAGETTYRVPSLSVPNAEEDFTAERLADCDSVRLFDERVRLHRQQFVVTDQNAPALANICRRLDGIPLAIELAAARVRSMSVDELDQGLANAFRLLTEGARTALPRQKTLRALIDWSYELLSGTEQVLLGRLAVFAGGWTLEAAEHVCTDESIDRQSVLDLLTSLADKSLVLAEERDGVTRYRLLETVRQYARERLMAHGEEAHWRDRHLAYFVAYTESVEPLLKGSAVQAGLDRMETEHDNLRLALDWAESGRGDGLAGLRIAAAVWWFWQTRGHWREGRRRLSRLLAVPATEALAIRAKALRGAGALARRQSDYAASEMLYRESLAIRRRLGDRGGLALTLGSLGALAIERGDWDASRPLLEESLTIQRELGDRASVAQVLNCLGELAYYQDEYAAACVRFEESLAIYRDLGNRWGIGTSIDNLGKCAQAVGDIERALELGRQGLGIQRKLRDLLAIAWSLETLACVATASGDPGRAARIWGSSARLRDEVGAPMSLAQQPGHAAHVAKGRSAMGDDSAFDSAWQQGRAMTLEQAIGYALGESAEGIDIDGAA